MKKNLRVAHLAACLILLCACSAAGPAHQYKDLADAAIPDGKARLVFFRTRESALYLARNAAVTIDGGQSIGIGYGALRFRDVDPGELRLRADMWDMPGHCELLVTVVAGETYYFQVDPRSASLFAFAAGDLATQLLSQRFTISVIGGIGTAAAESYGQICGGAFRLYPVDAQSVPTAAADFALPADRGKTDTH